MFIKGIDISKPFIISETNPFAIQFGPARTDRSQVVLYRENKSGRFAQVGAVPEPGLDNRCLFIPHQLKITKFAPSGGSPGPFPFRSLHVFFIPGPSHHDHLVPDGAR
jgi:hypothetical protein